MTMDTIIRIRGHNARWTPQGWRSGDAAVDRLCAVAESLAPFHYDPNPQRSAAERVASFLKGEIISVRPQEESDPAPPHAVY